MTNASGWSGERSWKELKRGLTLSAAGACETEKLTGQLINLAKVS